MPDEKIEKMFARLMASQGLAGLSAEKALEQIGLLIDLSGDLAREEGTARALEWADELEKGSLSASDAALLKYFRGNAWANRQKLRQGDRAAAWAWEQSELQQQLLHLRGAVQHEGFGVLPDLRQCQIFTNLANQINSGPVRRITRILEPGSGDKTALRHGAWESWIRSRRICASALRSWP